MKAARFLIVFFVISCLLGCSGEKKEETQANAQIQKPEIPAPIVQERKLIDNKTGQMVTESFTSLKEPVELIYFTQDFECQFCQDTRQLLSEVAGFSDKVELVVYDFVKDKAIAGQYGVDKIPATVIKTKNGVDKGIKFYGIPGGYEFGTLLESIKLVSTGEHGFSEEMLAKIQKIDKPAHLQVIVTPT